VGPLQTIVASADDDHAALAAAARKELAEADRKLGQYRALWKPEPTRPLSQDGSVKSRSRKSP